MGTRLRLLSLLIALAVSPAGVALGQQAQPGQPAPTGQPARQETGAVNVDRLPLDLQRLEKQLRRTTETARREGLRLEYNIQVFGRAPRIDFFTPDDVRGTGPIPYGAPTHREMLDVMTPKEYRAPAADVGAFMRWLNGKLNK